MNVYTKLWTIWDATFRVIWRVKPLDNSGEQLFCLVKGRYLGRPFTVDGVMVQRFDPVIEIHLNNKLLQRTVREETNIIKLAQRLRKEALVSLPTLANAITSTDFDTAQVLLGVTLIHRSIERFGFQAFPVKNRLIRRFLQWYLGNLLRAFNPNVQMAHPERPEMFEPKLVAVSKNRIIHQYGVHQTSL